MTQSPSHSLPPLTLDATLLARAQNEAIDPIQEWTPGSDSELIRGLMEGEFSLCPSGHVQASDLKLTRSLKRRALVSAIGHMLAQGSEDEQVRGMTLWVGVLEYVQAHQDTQRLLRRQAWTETLVRMSRCVQRFTPGQSETHAQLGLIQEALSHPPDLPRGSDKMTWEEALTSLRVSVLRVHADRRCVAREPEARRAM